MTESGGLFTSRAVTCIFNAFLSYTAIMLNILTFLALRKTFSLPKPLKTLLLSLAVSDLGIGLVVQPLHISRLAMELQADTDSNSYHNICSAIHKTGVVFFYASFLGVSALTVDRFLAIRLHLRYNELVTHRRVVALAILIWLFSAFTSMASVWIPKTVRVVFAVAIVALCSIGTVSLYYKIWSVARRHKTQIQTLQAAPGISQRGRTSDSHFLNSSLKAARVSFLVNLIFVACYLPNTLAIATAAKGSNEKSGVVEHLSLYTLTLLFLNSSLNPLIYCWKMRHIRYAIKSILREILKFLNNNN